MTQDEGADFVLRNCKTRLVVVGGFYPPGPDWRHFDDVERIMSVVLYRSILLDKDKHHYGRAQCVIPYMRQGVVPNYEPLEFGRGPGLTFFSREDIRAKAIEDVGCLPYQEKDETKDYTVKVVNFHRATPKEGVSIKWSYKELKPYNFDMIRALERVAEQLRVKRNQATPDLIALIDELINGISIILSDGQKELQDHLAGLLDI